MDVVNPPAAGPDPLDGLTLGSPEWHEAVYRAYRDTVWRAASSVLGNETRDSADAEDIAEEIFSEVRDGKHIDATTRSIPAVLCTRARQRAIDRTNRGAKTADGNVPERVTVSEPFDEVELERLGAVVHKNFRDLDERERYVYRRLYLDRAKPGEVAVELELSRVRIIQIRDGLRKKLLRGTGIG